MSATYPLKTIKELMGKGAWFATIYARNTALAMGFDEEDICDCIMNHLEDSHFYQTKPAEKAAGLMQDYYRITYEQWPIFLKLQINLEQKVVVVSFKAD
jgi:MqsR (Motility quorum-sensing regulator) toxin of toxin-antitoxin system